MVSTTTIDIYPELKRAGRHVGYGIAVVVNVLMLVVVLNILDWGWLPFLTDEFVNVIPWIGLSLVASIVANLIYQFNDSVLVKSTGQIGTNLISIVATYQLLSVFPFDFSAYDFNWGIVVGVLLILAMVGAGIGIIAEAYKLVSHVSEGQGGTMSTTSESVQHEALEQTRGAPQLYRSNSQRVVAGVCGGLGEYFAVDPVWFRIGFAVLALGGGSGILIYLLMWLIVQPRPDGQVARAAASGSVTGAAVVGVVFILVGTIALVNTIAPWLAQYFWPVVFVLGGLALVIGGFNRDDHR